ncbi:MAG TPA: hypothetical protein VIQ26_03725 [Microbacteriaceae bacterium]
MTDQSGRTRARQRSMMMAIISGTAALATLAGCTFWGSNSAEIRSTPGPTVSTALGQQPAISRALSGRAYQVAYDPYRDAIWYVVMRMTTPPAIPKLPVGPSASEGSVSTPIQVDADVFEASASSGQVIGAFVVPNPDGDTGLSDGIGIAPDHSVWIAESYHLYRIDPTTSGVQTVALSRSVTGSVDTPIQGTFVTAMTFTSNSVLVGRNSVPFLQQWSLGLRPLANVALPSGDFGPSFLTTTGSGIRMMTYSTSDPTSVTGRQASIRLPSGAESPTALNGEQLEPQYLIVRPDHVTANLQGFDGSQILTVAGSSPQTLTWQPSSGSAIQLAWPKTTGKVTNPLGKQVPTQAWPQLEAAVVLPNDTLWIIATTPAGPALELYTAN